MDGRPRRGVKWWLSVPHRRGALGVSAAIACGTSLLSVAFAAQGATVTCTDATGRSTVVTNVPSVDCASPTARSSDSQRADIDACRREVRVATDAWKREQRRDRALLEKFPDEAAHARKRAAEIQSVRISMQQSNRRLATLAADRKPLLAEAEFYVGKPFPAKLAGALDANDAALAAQRQIRASQDDEVARIDAENDRQLEELRVLWTAPRAAFPGEVDCEAKVLGQRPRR